MSALEAFFAVHENAQQNLIRQYRPRLQLPALNAICATKGEYEAAIGEKWNLQTRKRAYRPASETLFDDLGTPGAHMDRESTTVVQSVFRFVVYRHGALTEDDMYDCVKEYFTEQAFRHEKHRCATVERISSLKCRNTVFRFVARTVRRTGGLRLWRQRSRFQDRYKIFEAQYDELPEYCDEQAYQEEGKSVDIRNIHALDTQLATMDITDVRHAYLKFNKIRFLINCEAAYSFLLDGPGGEPCLWATRMIWKHTASTQQIRAIDGLPDDMESVPGAPFGQERRYKRQKVAMPEPPRYMGFE